MQQRFFVCLFLETEKAFLFFGCDVEHGESGCFDHFFQFCFIESFFGEDLGFILLVRGSDFFYIEVFFNAGIYVFFTAAAFHAFDTDRDFFHLWHSCG